VWRRSADGGGHQRCHLNELVILEEEKSQKVTKKKKKGFGHLMRN
jgi:hypothetical protein